MANFPMFQMAEESVKFRFQEPFGSQAANLKSAGIIPPGLFRGYSPNPQPNYQLFINTDGSSGDSVGVVETTDHFSLTVRTEQQLVLDFSGHTTFPVFVVLRAEYSLSPHPFSGNTDAKIVTTQLVLPGDIRICSVTGIGALNAPIVDVSQADRNGGYLLTPGGNLAKLITPAGGLSTGSGAPVALPNSTFAFNLAKQTVVDFQVSLFQDRLDQTFHDSQAISVFALKNLNTLVSTDMWSNTLAHFDSGSSTYPTGFFGSGGIKRMILTLAAGAYSFQLTGRVAGPAVLTVTYPLTIVVASLGAP